MKEISFSNIDDYIISNTRTIRLFWEYAKKIEINNEHDDHSIPWYFTNLNTWFYGSLRDDIKNNL